MKAILQRVQKASVSVSGKEISAIQQGWLILLGIHGDDKEEDITPLVEKIVKLRAFTDESGKMNLNLKQIQGEALVVSQFTLYANCRKGTRPSFTEAAPPEKAEKLYLDFIQFMKSKEITVKTGSFGAKMTINIEADGPVTLTLDSPA